MWDNGHDAYFETRVLTADPLELVNMLYQACTQAVKDARIVSEKSTIDNAAFSSEVLKTVKKWRFREDPNANGDVPVSFPLKFVNKQ